MANFRENLLSKRIQAVFYDTYEEYSKWKTEDVRRTLVSFSASGSSVGHSNRASQRKDAIASSSKLPSYSPVLLPLPFITDSEPEVIKFEMTHYTKPSSSSIHNASASSSTLLAVVQTLHPNHVPHYATYEMTAPIGRNLLVGDDSDYMPFLPFADDPAFYVGESGGGEGADEERWTLGGTAEEYSDEYGYFAWQDIDIRRNEAERDRDLQMITLVTAYRLKLPESKLSGITIEEIDASNVLPFRIFSNDSSCGVTHALRLLDLPKWPPLRFAMNSIGSDKKLNTDAQSSENNYFCPNPNCVVGFCTVHLDPIPPPRPTSSTLTPAQIFASISEPCGEKCCLLPQNALPTHWTHSDIETFKTLVAYSPDTSPCNMSVICRKPCFEIFKRLAMISSSSTSAQSLNPNTKPILKTKTKSLKRSASGISNTTALIFDDHNSLIFTPHAITQALATPTHSLLAHVFRTTRIVGGRVDVKVLFACVQCRVVIAVQNQKTVGHVARGDVPASRLVANVSPNIVGGVRRDAEAGICNNVGIQQGRFKRTAVLQSQWGLGLFLAEPASEGNLILEYTGELIFEPTIRSRDHVARHKGRSYLFQLNPSLSVDGMAAGNEGRYMNHSKTPNCYASVQLVNGEHRIGIYASKHLEAGTELLFDYGDYFFDQNPSQVETSLANSSGSTGVDYSLFVTQDHPSDDTYVESELLDA